MNALLKVGSGIDELVQGNSRPEEKRIVEAPSNELFDYLFKEYEAMLEKNFILEDHFISSNAEKKEYVSKPLDKDVTPADITAFLQATVNYERNKNYENNN